MKKYRIVFSSDGGESKQWDIVYAKNEKKAKDIFIERINIISIEELPKQEEI